MVRLAKFLSQTFLSTRFDPDSQNLMFANISDFRVCGVALFCVSLWKVVGIT